MVPMFSLSITEGDDFLYKTASCSYSSMAGNIVSELEFRIKEWTEGSDHFRAVFLKEVGGHYEGHI